MQCKQRSRVVEHRRSKRDTHPLSCFQPTFRRGQTWSWSSVQTKHQPYFGNRWTQLQHLTEPLGWDALSPDASPQMGAQYTGSNTFGKALHVTQRTHWNFLLWRAEKERYADIIVATLPQACELADVPLQLILQTKQTHLTFINGEKQC